MPRRPPSSSYTLEHGSYYLRDPNQTLFDERGAIVAMVDLVTIAYSCTPEPDGTELWVIHKHGDLKQLQAWWRANRETMQPLFGEVTLVTFPRGFDPERINAILDCPARLETLLAEVANEPRSTSTWDWLS